MAREWGRDAWERRAANFVRGCVCVSSGGTHQHSRPEYIRNSSAEVVAKKIFHPISKAVYALFTKDMVKVILTLLLTVGSRPKGPSAFWKRTVRRKTG